VQPALRTASTCSIVSSPSATISISSVEPISATALMIASLLRPMFGPETKLRSTLIFLNGNWLMYPSEE